MKKMSYNQDGGGSFVDTIGLLSVLAGLVIGGIGIATPINDKFLSEFELLRATYMTAGGISLFLFGVLLWGIGGILSVLKDLRSINEIVFAEELEEHKVVNTKK